MLLRGPTGRAGRALLVAGLCCLLPALLAGCVAAADTSSAVRVEPISLPPALREPGARIGELQLLAALSITGGDPVVGGLSSLLLDGDGLLLLSDRTRLFRAVREEQGGRLTGLRDWRELKLPRQAQGADTEAMTWLADGSLAISAESKPQFLHIDREGRALPAIKLPASLDAMPPNQGIEALATLGDGSLLAFSEGLTLSADNVLAGARFDPKRSTPLAIEVAPGFRPTGADRAGDWIFVLERRLSLLGGFEARVTAFDAKQLPTGPQPVIAALELARLSADTIPENFEGIAVRQERDGRFLIYLVSDDNFLSIQRTLLLQLAWTPPG